MQIKRIARALVAAGLAVVMTAGTAFASYGTGTISADALRMRSKPNTSSSILLTLTKGTKVDVLSDEENGWYKVSYKGTEGYMSADWLNVTVTASVTETPAEEPAPADPQPTAGTVNAGPLNVRSGPGTDYDRVGALAKGAKVSILESTDGWYKITVGSLTGYVSAEYITVTSTQTQSNSTTSQANSSTPEPSNVLLCLLLLRGGPGNRRRLCAQHTVLSDGRGLPCCVINRTPPNSPIH